jgi:hypothetical protein
MFKSRLGICAALLAVLAVAVPLASAAEASPVDEYKERAEPICKTNVDANKQIFQGVEKMVKEDKLKQAAGHFRRAVTAFGKTIRQLAAIPQPPEYEAKLGKWLDLLGVEKEIIGRIGKALAAEDKRKAEKMNIELRKNTNKANNTVLLFGFNYCRIEQSRFG